MLPFHSFTSLTYPILICNKSSITSLTPLFLPQENGIVVSEPSQPSRAWPYESPIGYYSCLGYSCTAICWLYKYINVMSCEKVLMQYFYYKNSLYNLFWSPSTEFLNVLSNVLPKYTMPKYKTTKIIFPFWSGKWCSEHHQLSLRPSLTSLRQHWFSQCEY